MTDPLTTNKLLAQPTRGSDSGTWDTPMNNNTGIIDNSFGGVATIALTNSNVQLNQSQYQCVFIKLTGAITSNITLTFPGGIGSFYNIINQCTNSSAFTVTAQTTASATTTIGLPPGENTKIFLDGTSPQFGALPHHIGGYWHLAGQSVPAWVTACTVPPYLNCNGGSFSSAAYPTLMAQLGGTTLPDTRGRTLFALDQSVGTTGLSFLGTGGLTGQTLSISNLPSHNHTASDGGHTHGVSGGAFVTTASGAASFSAGATGSNQSTTATGNANITVGFTGGNSAFSILNPAVGAGLILIRAG